MAFVIWSIFSKSAVVQIKKCFRIALTSTMEICNLKNMLEVLHKLHGLVPIKSPKICINPSYYDQLLCPGCSEIPLPYNYVCVIGHHVCKDCRSKRLLCSNCQNPFRRLNTLNFTLEFGILVSYEECPYKSLHCQTCLLFGKSEKEHEISCEYMSIMCPLKGHNNCLEDTLKISEIRQHFYNLHSEDMYSDRNCFDKLMPMPNELDIQSLDILYSRPYIIEFDNKLYLINIYVHYPHPFLLCFCITRLGKTIENPKYGLKIKIQGMIHSIQWETALPHVSYVGVGFICCLSDFNQNIAVFNSMTGVREFIIEHEFYDIF